MRWPWIRAEEDIVKDHEETVEARIQLRVEVKKLDSLLDRIESTIEEGASGGGP